MAHGSPYTNFVNDIHEHKTTSATKDNIYIQRGHCSSLFTDTAATWNSLPIKLRNIENLNTFKPHLIRHVLKNFTRF